MRFSIMFLLVLCCFGIALGQNAPASQPQDVILTASLPKLEFVMGEDIVLGIVLQNRSNQDIEATSTLAITDYRITVIDAHGELVKDLPARANAVINFGPNGVDTVKAGDKLSDQTTLSLYFNLHAIGTYTVEVQRTVTDVKGNRYDLISNKIKFTVKKSG